MYAQANPAHPGNPGEFTGKRILLVEDDAIISIAEEQMLVRAGYQVVTARDALSALQESEKFRPDLILMDIDLGTGPSGTEAAAAILERETIPILFLSSHSEPEIVQSAERITSYGYVLKSSGETVILASIRMAFRLSRANESAATERDKFAAMMTHSPLGMLVLDAEQVIRYANGPAIQLRSPGSDIVSGMTLEAYFGFGCEDGMPSPECELHRAVKKVIGDRRRVGPLQIDCVPAWSKESVSLRFFVTEMSDGSSVLLTFEDVSEQRRLDEHNRILSRIAESESTVVIVTDENRRTTWVNGTCEAVTGFTAPELIGRNPAELLQGDGTDQAVVQEMRARFDAGLSFQGQILNYTKDKRPYWIWLDIQPVHDESGTLTHFVSVEHEIPGQA